MDLVLQACRQRQQRIKEKLAQVEIRQQTCSESDRPRWIRIEQELVESYRLEQQRITRLQSSSSDPPLPCEMGGPAAPEAKDRQLRSQLEKEITKLRQQLAQVVSESERSKAAIRADCSSLSLKLEQRDREVADLHEHLLEQTNHFGEIAAREQRQQTAAAQDLERKEQELTNLRWRNELEAGDRQIELTDLAKLLGQREELLAELQLEVQRRDREIAELQEETEDLLQEIQTVRSHAQKESQGALLLKAEIAELNQQLQRRQETDFLDAVVLTEEPEDVSFSSIEAENPPDWLLKEDS